MTTSSIEESALEYTVEELGRKGREAKGVGEGGDESVSGLGTESDGVCDLHVSLE